ncbi:hypothetical protein QBC34DRAFT_118795 [Podospora aff. communis PSN243]|uniref:Uncharacterized protein n=1 Tax=Podospora aff. communis PSN243 TaxID=3040156 RepID=A0AAV9GH65_9PEZI|nr:hypothetical protein QBC34DRAFT_118795 [Podospora aff. communis PSN243]
MGATVPLADGHGHPSQRRGESINKVNSTRPAPSSSCNDRRRGGASGGERDEGDHVTKKISLSPPKSISGVYTQPRTSLGPCNHRRSSTAPDRPPLLCWVSVSSHDHSLGGSQKRHGCTTCRLGSIPDAPPFISNAVANSLCQVATGQTNHTVLVPPYTRWEISLRKEKTCRLCCVTVCTGAMPSVTHAPVREVEVSTPACLAKSSPNSRGNLIDITSHDINLSPTSHHIKSHLSSRRLTWPGPPSKRERGKCRLR